MSIHISQVCRPVIIDAACPCQVVSEEANGSVVSLSNLHNGYSALSSSDIIQQSVLKMTDFASHFLQSLTAWKLSCLIFDPARNRIPLSLTVMDPSDMG